MAESNKERQALNGMDQNCFDIHGRTFYLDIVMVQKVQKRAGGTDREILSNRNIKENKKQEKTKQIRYWMGSPIFSGKATGDRR